MLRSAFIRPPPAGYRNLKAMLEFQRTIEYIGVVIDLAGVLAIVAGLVYAILSFARSTKEKRLKVRELRQNLGLGILVGLEILIAADIVRTVAMMPTLQSVAILGLIVLIRTFLSIALQVELEGRWPWKRAAAPPRQP